ncbi:hypothetical protein BC829DRAFT_413025 [Chytridium lagenaria]|nr:hypothetical protein BC829DRAFT_413025 [Chytridium lagenaria]
MDGIQNEKRDNISTFNQKLKTADLSQPTANFVTPTGGDDFTNRMIPKVEESKISAAISETPLPYKSSLSLKSSPLKGSTAEILAAKEVSISKEKIEKMETHQDSQMLYATPGEKERARRRENALNSEPTALLNPTEVEKRTERIEVKAATTTANDSMNIPLNMTLKASLKGVNHGRIIKAQQDGDNEVVVTACVTRKKEYGRI